jgi:cyclic pyranopterin monophosphate synthase
MTGEPEFTHLDEEGRPRMVDVTGKADTARRAVAEGHIRMSVECLEAIETRSTAKGDVLQVARIAAITGGKRTGELIPLCHMLPGASLVVDLVADRDLPGVRIRTEASVAGPTGVEMEALTAAAIGLLTVYDMVKSIDRTMEIGGVRLLSKSGGRSSDWRAEG